MSLVDAAKGSACFYSGYFTVKYLFEKKDSKADLDSL